MNLAINIKNIVAGNASYSVVIDENNNLWQSGIASYCSLIDVTYPTLERIY